MWLVIGLGIALFLKARRPDAMRNISQVFVDGDLEPGSEVLAAGAAGPAPLGGSL